MITTTTTDIPSRPRRRRLEPPPPPAPVAAPIRRVPTRRVADAVAPSLIGTAAGQVLIGVSGPVAVALVGMLLAVVLVLALARPDALIALIHGPAHDPVPRRRRRRRPRPHRPHRPHRGAGHAYLADLARTDRDTASDTVRS